MLLVFLIFVVIYTRKQHITHYTRLNEWSQCSSQPLITEGILSLSAKYCVERVPLGLCRTFRTAGSSAGWSVSRGRRWRSCWSRCETLSPSWWWWRAARWSERAHESPCWKSQREMWWIELFFPNPSRLPECSFSCKQTGNCALEAAEEQQRSHILYHILY